jgi:hypothetical protein
MQSYAFGAAVHALKQTRHNMVIASEKRLSSGKPDRGKMLASRSEAPCIAIHVSADALGRALNIMNAMIMLNNQYPAYLRDGTLRMDQTYTVGPSSVPNIGDELSAAGISWKY